jgi:hypothetical protein
MGINGHDPIQAAIERANQEQQHQQMLGAVLQQTMLAPAVIKTAATSLTGVADDGPTGRMIRVALPNGERWDIPLSPQAQEAVARALIAPVAEAA